MRLPADRPLFTLTSELVQVMIAAREREQAGHRMCHLERGEPDFDTPPHIVEALAAATRAGETHYPEVRGSRALREALVEKLARENRIDCHFDDVTVTTGGTHALWVAFHALLSPGDEILVFSPHWMALPKLIAMAHGARFRTLPLFLDLIEDRVTPAELADRLRAALRPETRGIYVNSPHNPTGAVLDRPLLEAIARVALERDLWVVSDEAYEHLLFDGVKHESIGSFPDMAERTVSVYTFSKSYAMTGWRVGYLVTPPALRPVTGPLLAGYTTYGVFPAIQSACLAAVKGPQDAVEAMRREYQTRRDLLLEGLEGQGAIRVPRPRGAFYAFADVSGALAGRDLWGLVHDWIRLGVAVLPGVAFGSEYPHHVRLSIATRRDDVVEGARLLREQHAVAASSAPR